MTNKELLKQLKAVAATKQGGLVDAEWMQNNRQILMSQIAPQHSTVTAERSNYTAAFFGEVFGQRLLRPVFTSLIVVAAFLGYTATSSLANTSLPGDLLYPIKTTTEKVQLALTFDEEKKVNLQLDFVGRRTTELEQIVMQKDTTAVQTDKVVAAVKQISSDVQSIQDSLKKINQDTGSAVAIAKAVDAKTLAVSESIAVSHSVLPEEVKQEVAPEVTSAINASESAGNTALGVIVTSYEADNSTVNGEELSSRLTERLKKVEQNIDQVAQSVAQETTTSSTLPATPTSSSTAKDIAAAPKLVHETVAVAISLLNQKDFGSALEKLQQSQELVDQATKQAASISATSSTPNVAPASTTASSTATSSPPAASTGH